jgi:hypothetical protein
MAMKHESQKPARDEGHGRTASDLLSFASSYLLFFILCLLYLWLVVEPHLIYYCFGTILPDAPLFAAGWSFLNDSLGRPGGAVIYVSGFLSQGYYHAWLGAGIIVLAGFSLAELSRRHLRTAGLAHAFGAASLPALAFFLVYSHYKHPLPICLAVSLGLLYSLLFERLPLPRVPVRAGVFCLMAAVGFWFGGAGTMFIFAITTAIHRVLAHRDWRTIALALPASIALAWALAQYVFLIPAGQALLVLTPLVPSQTANMNTFLRVLVFLLYGFTPLAVLLVFLGKGVLGQRAPKAGIRPEKSKAKEKHRATPRRRLSPAIFLKPSLYAIPLALLGLGLYLSHDALRKPYVLSNYYSREGHWDKIVALNLHLPKDRTNPFVNHDYLRALYHTGRLPYDMFKCPLIPEALLLTHEQRQSDLSQWKLCDIFLELGHVNMAQRLAAELVATKSCLGIALEKLAWIAIIKGEPAASRVYLNALRKDLICRGRAQSLLHALDNGFTPEQTAYMDRIRSYPRDETAGPTGAEPVDQTLAALLKHNPRNKMAFEYLMACYLITDQVDKIVENMDRLKDLGYQAIPTLYEEAILIYYGSREQQVDLAHFNISPETLQRYEAFVQIARTMQPQNEQAVLQRLIQGFGTSYFFYYTFGRVGLM